MKTCLNCQTPLVSTIYCRTKKYCSKRCREIWWKKLHPEKWKEHQKNYRLKTPVVCIFCNKEIPPEQRRSGKQLCSNECIVNQSKVKAKERRKRISILFRKYKEKLGCCGCGYSKNGACLDFHHEDGKEKERRITSGLWYSHSKLFKEEVKKCKLLCKVCHYDLHNPIEN